MGKKYVATILDKHYVGDENFLYSCNHVVVGEIDDETLILKDEFGNEYRSMLSSEVTESPIPYAYGNILEVDKIDEQFSEEDTFEDKLKEYELRCRTVMHYVGKTDSGKTYLITLDKDNLDVMANNKEISDEEEYDYEADEFREDINALIMDIINGVYSSTELRELREDVLLNRDSLDSVIDTIDLQIEANESNRDIIEVSKEYEEELVALEEEIEEDQKKELIDLKELFNNVTKTLIAQDEAARRVIAEIARKEMDDRKKKEGILLTGSTGVGKTELMRLIAKYLDRPFYKIDSTQLTTPGYTGRDIEEVLWDLYIQCGRDIELTENAIIFFDEIDKKGSEKKDDHSGQGVLNVLLQFIEGTTYQATKNMKSSKETVPIDTSRMTVILGGAYTDVYNNIANHAIGFNNSKEEAKKNVSTKDFVEKGLMTEEFMGRVMVVKLNDLDVEAIKRIMLESDESSIRIQQEIFEKLGVRLTFTDGYTDRIAQDAYKKKTGARGLNGIIDETTWQAFEEVYSNPEVYEEVILNEETVADSSNYQLIKRPNEIHNNE